MFLLFMLVRWALWLIELAVVAVVIAGWLRVSPENPVLRALKSVVDPLFQVVRPIAKIIPGPIDWSPAIVLFALHVTRRLLGA